MSDPIPLSSLQRTDAERSGRKASVLGELMQEGFSIPEGFVVFPVEPGSATDLGGVERAALVLAWAAMGGGVVAVRSSGIDEDLSGASFAGQYQTILNVDSSEALLEAVEVCRSSGDSELIRKYASAYGITPRGVAVLVQRQLKPECAGIAFSADPITGDRTQVVINAVPGLGDRAASGEETSEQWHVDKTGAYEILGRTSDVLSPVQALEVADLARRVETYFDEPQNIEWAIAGDDLYLLQARPITALPTHVTPIPVSVNPPDGYWMRDSDHAPKPNTPLYSSLVLPHTANAGRRWFGEYGFLLDGMSWQEIGGWQYLRLVPLRGKDRKPPPEWLMPLIRRLDPRLRARVKDAVRAIRTDRADDNLRRWGNEWRPELDSRAKGLLAVALDSLGDLDLLRHLDNASSLIHDALEIHFLLHGAGFLHLAELVWFSSAELGWDETETLELLSGLSGTSTEPAKQLAELSQWATADPELSNIFLTSEHLDVAVLEEIAPEFADAFRDYLEVYGSRAVRYEIVDPTLRETPGLLLRLIRDQISSGFNPEVAAVALAKQAEMRLSNARQILRANSEGLTRFEEALARARLAYPIREDSEFFTVSLPLGVARFAVLEIGDRLAGREQIGNRDDVFYLEYPEARDLLSTEQSGRDIVSRRRGERAWIQAHPGPPSYGTEPGPPPSLDGFPEEARRSMDSLLWGVERAFATEMSDRTQVDATQIVGIGASPGEYRGRAVRVMDETEFDRIRQGDVLICPVTSPVWSVVFPRIGALVTDHGGILSHPAIIAREYRVPAVVATGNATSLITDGQIVSVDGSTGFVRAEG